MVVGSEPRFCEPVCLILRDHAQRDARFHLEVAHAAHHVEHLVELGSVFHLAPGGAHAEPGSPGVLGQLRLGEDVVHVEQGLALQARLLGVVRGLRAVFAILGAGAGLDGKQARELNLPVRMEPAVDGARFVQQLKQRRLKQVHDFEGLPVMAYGRAGLALTFRLAN